MIRDPGASRPSDGELKRALRAAVEPPFEEVEWERLYGAIMAEAAQVQRRPAREWELIARWSRRGIPAAMIGLAAALIGLWLLPTSTPASQAAPPEAWPVAQELISGLPEDTRTLLAAGTDVSSMLRVMVAHEEAKGNGS